MPVALSSMVTEQRAEWGQLAAGGVLTMLPVIVFSLLVRKVLSVRGRIGRCEPMTGLLSPIPTKTGVDGRSVSSAAPGEVITMRALNGIRRLGKWWLKTIQAWSTPSPDRVEETPIRGISNDDSD